MAGNHRSGGKRLTDAKAPRTDRYKENNQIDVVSAGKPMPPRQLSTREQQLFDHLVGILEEKKTISEHDGHAITLVAEQVIKLEEAKHQIASHGTLIWNDKGEVKENPAMKHQKEATNYLTKALIDYDLAPVNRKPIEDDKDGLLAMLGG